ncbi:hypothetical protein GCM10028821_37310 [Hymenobacter jeollabukensis]
MLRLLLPGLGALALLTACEKEDDTTPQAAVDNNGLAFITNTIPVVAKYASGEVVNLEVSTSSPEQVDNIQLYQVNARLDSGVVATIAPSFTYNETTRAQSQVVTYTVPTGLPNQRAMRLDVIVNFKDGNRRVRRVSYNVANAPAIKFSATPATYRNGLDATRQAPGDIITYSLILNENGINVIPAAGSSAPLFKTLDSLAYFVKVGNGPETRIGSVRLSTGAAATRTVDVTVPNTATPGQQVAFRFVSYAIQQTASVTGTVTVVAPSVFSQTRTNRSISAGLGANTDSLAFNLRTGLNETAAAAAANKDLYLSFSGTSVTLNAGNGTANTTRIFRLPAAENSVQFYNTATVNAVARRYYQAGTTSQVTSISDVAVNDVFLIRVRGAEFMLLRVTGVRPGTNGAISRLKFEYKLL